MVQKHNILRLELPWWGGQMCACMDGGMISFELSPLVRVVRKNPTQNTCNDELSWCWVYILLLWIIWHSRFACCRVDGAFMTLQLLINDNNHMVRAWNKLVTMLVLATLWLRMVFWAMLSKDRACACLWPLFWHCTMGPICLFFRVPAYWWAVPVEQFVCPG